MGVFGVDPDAVRRQADLLEASADDVRSARLTVPDPGSTCDRTAAGLALVEQRCATLAEHVVVCAITMRRLAGFYPEVDDAVARDLGGS